MEVFECATAVMVCFGKGGVELNCSVEVGEGGLRPSEFQAGIPAAEVVLRPMGIRRDGAVERVERPGKPAGLQLQHTEQVERVGQGGLVSQDPLVERLCCFDLAPAMVAKRSLQQIIQKSAGSNVRLSDMRYFGHLQ